MEYFFLNILDLTDKPKKFLCGEDFKSKDCTVYRATHMCTIKVIIQYMYNKNLFFKRFTHKSQALCFDCFEFMFLYNFS